MGAPEFADHSWIDFIETTTGRGPLEYFHSAMDFVDGNRGDGRQAVDLGCGGGADTRAMLARGWRVFATDAEPEAESLIKDRLTPEQLERLVVAIGPFHEIDLPPADLVYAQFSLPFAGDYLDASTANALEAVVPGGAFVGQLFGARDDWAVDPNVAYVDESWIERTFRDFGEVDVDERSHEGPYGTERMTKHWHFFHIRARR